MNQEQFDNYIEQLPCGEYIVSVYYKYDDEQYYSHSNEHMTITPDYIEWLDDWNEGFDDIQYEGCLPINEISVFGFWLVTVKGE